MDSPVSTTIAGLSLVLSGFATWWTLREGRKRVEWEQARVREQTAFTQPDPVPIGLRWAGAPPKALDTEGAHDVNLHNEGGSTPSQVVAVLFPSAAYWNRKGEMPATRIEGLNGRIGKGVWTCRPKPTSPAGRCCGPSRFRHAAIKCS